MSDTKHENVVSRLVELLLDDPVISEHAISTTNYSLGRLCLDSEDFIDHKWWDVHGSIVRRIIMDAYAYMNVVDNFKHTL
jgi:predicted N-formylglutamate amidohydrolase